MIQNPAKCGQTPQISRGLYTPTPVRGRVLASHLIGKSNRQIADEEGIDRETVSRILSQQEVAHMIGCYQSRLLRMIPKAIRTYEAALESDDLRLAVAAATKLMEGLRVLNAGFVEQSPSQPNQQKIHFLGEMLNMMLEKNRSYDVPLPPELAQFAEEHQDDRFRAVDQKQLECGSSRSMDSIR